MLTARRRPPFLRLVRLVAFFAAIPFGALANDRPNILWITAEDMSLELGCYGDTYARTPNIDRFAAQGIRYTRAFAESPVCAPSRSTLITGMHNGPLGTSQMRSNHRIPSFVRGFPALLREAGYYTTNNSKTDYNLAAEKAFINDAWDESSPKAHWRDRPAGKPFFAVFNYMDTHQSRTSRNDLDFFKEKVQSRLAPKEIHDPAQAPLPPFYPDTEVTRRTVARYHDCVTSLDHFVARKLAALETDGLADDTIVFFYSDHGAGMPGGKAAPFAYGLRVPLLVRFPEKYQHLASDPPGTVTNRLVGFVDFAATVLNLAGLEIPSHMHGRPFLGPNLPEPRVFLTGARDRHDETLETTRWITDGRSLLVRSYDPRPYGDQQTLTSLYNANGEIVKEIRSIAASDELPANWPRFWNEGRPPVMLFDMEQDPWCLANLVGTPAHEAEAEALLSRLEAFLLEERDLGFWPEPERTDAEQGKSAWEQARVPDRYPLKRILATARLAGFGADHLDELVKRSSDPDPSVRYWATLGLAVLAQESEAARGALAEALDDEAASVRIAGAGALARFGDSAIVERAMECLVAELESPNPWAACRAARAIELAGEPARPHLAAVEKVLRHRSAGFFGNKGQDPVNYGLEFSLRATLAQLKATASSDN